MIFFYPELQPCTVNQCPEWQPHAHGIDPEYPTVCAVFRTPEETERALSERLPVVKGGPWQR